MQKLLYSFFYLFPEFEPRLDCPQHVPVMPVVIIIFGTATAEQMFIKTEMLQQTFKSCLNQWLNYVHKRFDANQTLYCNTLKNWNPTYITTLWNRSLAQPGYPGDYLYVPLTVNCAKGKISNAVKSCHEQNVLFCFFWDWISLCCPGWNKLTLKKRNKMGQQEGLDGVKLNGTNPRAHSLRVPETTRPQTNHRC